MNKKCEWCDKDADDWGYDGVELCEECRSRQLEDIEEAELAEMEIEQ